ncbi:uncharacterized protein E0L32_002849 [Thyridium curvatum]|uniref:Uncharacterized protein n=1 Tax=Thyridium curvatum TaxID=1093900 RepID=A0A507BM02_9PEZI|nr:uncharacterized protein E0L32_002849 [Thyridium curvatum]TPX17748.1 hypothetical protein E0L32_002849 [Thyridium curvatum]
MEHLTAAKCLQAIGLATLSYFAYKIVLENALWLLPKTPLTRYQRPSGAWVFITGASAGIGQGCAQEFAARGFNLVLLGHLPAELEQTKALILAESPQAHIRIIVLDAITAKPADIEAALQSVADLPLTVLINNVGGNPVARQPVFKRLDQYTAAEVTSNMAVNAGFMAQLTRLAVPVLARNGPSLVVNLSSGAKTGIPGVAMYSACKAFVHALSKAVAREMIAEGMSVDVVSLVPGDVKTLTNDVVPKGSPDPRSFSKVLLDRLGTAVRMGSLELSPWYFHQVQIWLADVVPERVMRNVLVDMFKRKARQTEAGKKEQ